VALALGTGHWDGRTRIARDFSEDASLSFRAGHRGRIAVFESPRPEQVLSYDAEFQRLAMPPANPRVQPHVAGHIVFRQMGYVVQSIVKLHVSGQIEEKPDLKHVFRRVAPRKTTERIQAVRIQFRFHLNPGITGADPPAAIDAPGG